MLSKQTAVVRLQICIVEHPYYLVRVRAECVNKATGEYVTSNVFHFAFAHDADEEEALPAVVPKSYGGGRWPLQTIHKNLSEIFHFVIDLLYFHG